MPVDFTFLAGAALASADGATWLWAGVGAFVVLLLVAAACDIATMTIPNWVSIALALAFPIFAFASGASVATVALHYGVALGVFAAGFALFTLGVMGGGDVKVIAAVSVWTGAAGLSAFFFGMAIAGGALAAGMLAVRKFAPAPSRESVFGHLLDRENGVPYAVAIALGALFALPHLPLAQPLAL